MRKVLAVMCMLSTTAVRAQEPGPAEGNSELELFQLENMLGQVTATEPDLTRAWVIAEGPSGRLETEVDDLGQFSLDGLVSGIHRMEIGLAYELIEIPSVQI